MDGERVVFTALFHIQRGQCCGNGCRHCPYEPKYKKGNVVVAKEFIKFIIMDLKELEKQTKELSQKDLTKLTPEEIQKIVENLSTMLDEGENLLNNEIQEENERHN